MSRVTALFTVGVLIALLGAASNDTKALLGGSGIAIVTALSAHYADKRRETGSN